MTSRIGLSIWCAAWLMAGGLGFGGEPAGSPTEGDVAWLRSGERVRGELLGLDAQGRLQWRHPAIEETVQVPLAEVVKIRLAPRPAATNRMERPCLLRLANGDSLRGDLRSFDGETLVLQTWYGGEIRIPRKALGGLQPLVLTPKIVFQGPTSLEGWTLGHAVAGVQSNAWFYSDGALVSLVPGSVARDVKLPDQAQISFQLDWEGYTQLAVALYADSLQPIQLASKDEGPDFGGFYSLQMFLANIFNANLLPVKKGVPLNNAFGLGVGYVQTFTPTNRADIMVRVNKRERTVHLYYNGELVRRWQDPMDTLGPGTAMRFVNQGPGSVRLSRLVVSEWDGRLELQTNTVNNLTNDVVFLLNQDQISGTLGPLEQDQWRIETRLGPILAPFQRIEQLHFSLAGRLPVPRQGQKTRLAFVERDTLTGWVEGWENGTLTVNHPLLGALRIQAAAVRYLEWD